MSTKTVEYQVRPYLWALERNRFIDPEGNSIIGLKPGDKPRGSLKDTIRGVLLQQAADKFSFFKDMNLLDEGTMTVRYKLGVPTYAVAKFRPFEIKF